MVSPQSNRQNTLGTLLSQMCQEAGKKTIIVLGLSHRSYMFNAQVPEKRSLGMHRSSKALALYERPSLAEKQAVSKVLAKGGSFDLEVNNITQQQQASSSDGATMSDCYSADCPCAF